MERKAILREAIMENDAISITRYVFDKRIKDWIKIKFLKDGDYVVYGYIRKNHGMTSLVLGQYRDKDLIYKRSC